jgi:uncharacterized protein (DUF1015 family)
VADVRPFRAVTYALHDTPQDLTSKAAPPYDVVDEAERSRLIAADPSNIVAIELAEGQLDAAVPSNRYETAGRRWEQWLSDGTLVEEPSPALWVVEQSFVLHGVPAKRRSVYATVKIEPFSAGVVLPHERTLPKARADRLAMIRATAANLSPVVGLYGDPEGTAAAALESATASTPALVAEVEGVQARAWRVLDAAAIADFTGALAHSPVYIADGHHRYETALAYRDERRVSDRGADADPPYDHIMMALLSMDDPDLVVLPTHRVANASGDFDAAAFMGGLSRDFDLREVPFENMIDLLDEHWERPSYLMRVRGDGRLYLVTLKPDVDLVAAVTTPMSSAWKALDVAVLQELVLDPLLDIHPDRPETLDRLRFVKGAESALRQTADNDVVFVMNRTRLEQLRAVAAAGETMPQKSTYFHPKVPSGLLMRSLRQENA